MTHTRRVLSISELWAEVGKAYAEMRWNRAALDELSAQCKRTGLMVKEDSEGGFVPPRQYN